MQIAGLGVNVDPLLVIETGQSASGQIGQYAVDGFRTERKQMDQPTVFDHAPGEQADVRVLMHGHARRGAALAADFDHEILVGVMTYRLFGLQPPVHLMGIKQGDQNPESALPESWVKVLVNALVVAEK